jgi:membrane protease YdiL (CAAX protease family)
MNRRILWGLSAIAFLALVLWGQVFSAVFELVDPDVDQLSGYLIDKGLFAVALLVVLAKWDGLRNYGFERGRSWWFLVTGAPIIVLTALLLLNPESPFGLGMAAALGWILVSTFVAIGEEGLFRGLLWRALEGRGMLTTSLLTSALFGTVHLVGLFTPIPWQIIASQVVFAAGGGMMFAAVRLASGSLLAPIILHALFDSCALVAAGGAQEMFSDTMSVGRLLVPGLAFFVWGLICVLVIRRRRRTTRAMPPATEVLQCAP